ncbi:MAG TPA: ATP synthase F1 subunit gamma [Candidatus Paceibacterota bacterium]|nr:ATP synthase F1 subunit gamma [Candidatus Paceibacterota bacterium]
MALKDIKGKIQATKRMHTVTRAMEAVSAVKMRKTQATAFAGRTYARAALSVLSRLAGTRHMKEHPLGADREGNKLALIVITSDKGLAGALNSGVIKRAVEALEGRAKEDVTIYAIGKKGEDFFRRRGYVIERAVENKRDDVEVSLMEELVEELTAGFLSGRHDKVSAVYSNFKSTFEQIPTMRRLLPLSLSALQEIVEGITPEKGKWAGETGVPSAPKTYEVEPSADEVLSILIPRLAAIALYHMLLESKASEHSARMVAMKNASDKSKEVTRDLTRVYNKVRQAAITREVSEIVGGREALAS